MTPTSTRTTPTRTPTTRTRSGEAEALARCIEPVERARFFAEHWERRPLVVSRDEPGRYDELLTTSAVERLLESGGLRFPAFRLVRADAKLAPPDYTADVPWRPAAFTGMADVARVAAEFARGATLVVQGLHYWWPPLATFCRALERELGHPAQANAYWTPKAAQGLSVHHDTHDVFCLQVEGEKRWLVYDPVWELPLRAQRYTESMGEPDARPVLDVTLHPGDLLYLPRGWLHEATTSDAESLHLTIGVNVYSWLDAFRAAVDECADDVEFRRAADGGDTDVLVERLRARLSPDDVRARMRRKLVSGRRRILDRQFGQLRALDELDADTELERRPTVIAELDGTRLLFDGTALEFPSHLADDLEFLVNVEGPFRAGDLPGELDDESRLVLIRRLVREGFLVVSGA